MSICFLLTKAERYFWDQEGVREKQGEQCRTREGFRGLDKYTGGNSFQNGATGAADSDRRRINRRPQHPFRLDNPNRELSRLALRYFSSQARGTVRESRHKRKGLMSGVREAVGAGRLASECVATRSAIVESLDRQSDRSAFHAEWNRVGNRPYPTPINQPRLATRPATTITPQCRASYSTHSLAAGTTGVVAEALGRHFVGLDLSREYLGMAKQRIERPHKHIPRPGRVEHHPLFGGLE